MYKIGFIGAFDKTDLILYTAKILREKGKSILIIDTTITQKTKYVVPVINPTRTYFTEFEEMDVAVGFSSEMEIRNYLGLDENEELAYDYVLIDIDSSECFEKFNMYDAKQNYFITSMSLYSLKKGLEVLAGLNENINMTRVIFTRIVSKEDIEYIDFLSENYKINWNEESIYFPFEQGDESALIENERSAKIRTRNLSAQYKDSLATLVSQVTDEKDYFEIKKLVKKMDKGV